MSEEITNSPARRRVAAWRKNLADGNLSWSIGFCDLFDLQPDEVGGRLDAVLTRVHPDDRGALRDALSGVPELVEPWPTRIRLSQEDGSTRIVEIDWDLFMGSDSRPISVSGLVRDISSLMVREEELRGALEKARIALTEAAQFLPLDSMADREASKALASIFEVLRDFSKQ